jgi:hypothetical protein
LILLAVVFLRPEDNRSNRSARWNLAVINRRDHCAGLIPAGEFWGDWGGNLISPDELEQFH